MFLLVFTLVTQYMVLFSYSSLFLYAIVFSLFQCFCITIVISMPYLTYSNFKLYKRYFLTFLSIKRNNVTSVSLSESSLLIQVLADK